MTGALASILIGVAAKVGAPIVKGLLEKHVGGVAGDIGGSIVDAIATHAGVEADKLPELPGKDLEKAVLAVEAEAPELLMQWNVQQAQAIDLMKAEMEKGPFWSWAWRPAGMYLLGAIWTYYIVGIPLLNLLLRLSGSAEQLVPLVDVTTLMTISGMYLSLYMGGYTALKGIEKWKSGQ